jgi:hypothetical protein
MAFKTIYYFAKRSELIFLYIVAHNCMFDYVILQMKLLKNNFYPSNVFDLFWSYQVYGEEPTMRSAEDIAFHTALFIARKGSYVNYYMVW